jgi:hypothetical protein
MRQRPENVALLSVDDGQSTFYVWFARPTDRLPALETALAD